jgi:hypothetical protein
MFSQRRHLSAEELLLATDRDLSPRRLTHVRKHLEECPSCQARLQGLDRTLAEVTELYQPNLSALLPPASISRAELRGRLRELSARSAPSGAPSGRWIFAYSIPLVAGLGVIAVLAQRPALQPSRSLRVEPVVLLPRADLTPGTARPVEISEVCAAHSSHRPEPVAASVRQSVFESYGADHRQASAYELDYLITPELGGTSDAHNLWPQAYEGTVWNAYVKDELEQRLHRLACDGTIDLAQAQREITTDWIAAYKRHFHTDRPLRDYARSPLTERDGLLLRSELQELGISTAHEPDGPTLMAMLNAARHTSPSAATRGFTSEE